MQHLHALQQQLNLNSKAANCEKSRLHTARQSLTAYANLQ